MEHKLTKTKCGPFFLNTKMEIRNKRASQRHREARLCPERRAPGAEADHSPLNGRPAAALVQDYLHTKGSVREDTRG